MDSPTLRSRLVQLMQKSRKALRLYSSTGHLAGTEHAELSELQVGEWREVNADLLKQLSQLVASPNARKLSSEVFMLRDRFHAAWRTYEGELHRGQRSLVSASEHGDFIKVAIASRGLVATKARMQAAQAAYQELDELLRQCKLTPPIELSHADELGEADERSSQPTLAKVIPLRQRLGA